MEEELASVPAPAGAVLDRLVVGEASYLATRAAYEIDLVVRRIFKTVGNRIGHERDLRAVGVGSNFLDFIGTGRDCSG